MKFEIKARAYAGGHVLFTAELDAKYESEPVSVQMGAAVRAAVKARANLAGANLADADLADADLADVYLAGANLAGANLAGAILARADLAGANLADADLADVYLADANLAGANLAGANLAGAILARADLAGADLAGAKNLPVPSPEEIMRLDEVREIVLKQPKRLAMASWHSGNWTPEHTPEEEHHCGSAHCIAGWLQALHPDAKVRMMDPSEAGRMLAPASSYMFTASDPVALQWLTDRGYARMAEAARQPD